MPFLEVKKLTYQAGNRRVYALDTKGIVNE